MKNFCSQCGQRFTDPACGPTHALLRAEWIVASERLHAQQEAVKALVEACRAALEWFKDNDMGYEPQDKINAALAQYEEAQR